MTFCFWLKIVKNYLIKRNNFSLIEKKKKNPLQFFFLAAQSGILHRTIRKVLNNEKPDTKVRPCPNCTYEKKH